MLGEHHQNATLTPISFFWRTEGADWGESILDCRVVQGHFTKPSGRPWPQSRQRSPCLPEMGSHDKEQRTETCPQFRCHDGACPSSRSPWAQQSKMPSLSLTTSQGQPDIWVELGQSRGRGYVWKAGSCSNPSLPPMGTWDSHVTSVYSSWISSLSVASPGWKRKAVYTINTSVPKFFPEIHSQYSPSPNGHI